MSDYADMLGAHYARNWGGFPVERRWEYGPVHEMGRDFRVLEFAPSNRTFTQTYATCGMSGKSAAQDPIELHLLSPRQDDAHVELLTVIAHYHATGSTLGLHHTVNFGRPWLPGSRCDHGFISLPYPFGPQLEWFDAGDRKVRCLWLIPITADEVRFKRVHGVEALEQCFETPGFNYLDPHRKSLING